MFMKLPQNFQCSVELCFELPKKLEVLAIKLRSSVSQSAHCFCLIWTWKQFLCFLQNWWVTTEQLNSCFHVSTETDFFSGFGLLRPFYPTMASPLIISTLKNSWNADCFFPPHITLPREPLLLAPIGILWKTEGARHLNTTSVSFWPKWCIFS